MADPWHARLDFRRPAAAAVLVASLVSSSGCASMAPRANAGHAAFLAASAGWSALRGLENAVESELGRK